MEGTNYIGSNVAFVVPSPRTTTRAYGTCKAIRCRLWDTEGRWQLRQPELKAVEPLNGFTCKTECPTWL